MEQTTHYGAKMRAKREALGLSLSEARDRLLFAIPRRYVPSIKKLQRIETGEVDETKVDGLIVYGLAMVYGCRVSDLSTVVADELKSVSDLLERQTRCVHVPAFAA